MVGDREKCIQAQMDVRIRVHIMKVTISNDVAGIPFKTTQAESTHPDDSQMRDTWRRASRAKPDDGKRWDERSYTSASTLDTKQPVTVRRRNAEKTSS